MRSFSYFIIAVLAFALALHLILAQGLPNRADYTRVGQLPKGLAIAPEVNAHAPPFTLPTLDADPLALGALRGASVILNFWATWCEPCRVEMPALQTLYTETAQTSSPVRVVAVNLAEAPDVVQAWVDTLALTFDIVLDTQLQVAQLYRLVGQPMTYLIAPDGKITHIYYGAVDVETLRAALKTHQS